MRIAPRRLRPLRDERGNAAIEFALLAPLLFLIFFGIIEFGLIYFSQAVIDSAAYQATRESTIGAGGADRAAFIRDYIQRKTRGLIQGNDLIITTDITATPGDIQQERCTGGGYCPCTPPSWFDTDGDNNCDSAELDPGASGEIVRYRIIYPWRVQTPIMTRFVGNNGTLYLFANSIVRNEPF